MGNPYQHIADDFANVEYVSVRDRWPLLSESIYDTPLLILPEKAELIESVIRNQAMGTPLPVDAAQYKEDGVNRPYRVTTGGIAIIPVTGTLIRRGSWMSALSGLTSYQRINHQFETALSDGDVKGVLFDFDTPGGSGAGLFDFVDKIYTSRSEKPVWAVANEAAYSAGFALASAAEKIFVPRTSGVGSIGVIALHVDQSESDKKKGFSYTAIYAGDRKNDGNSHEPLSDRARNDIQSKVDAMYGLFVSTVSRNRSVDEKVIRDTQAGCYMASDAVDIGLADEIAAFDEVVEMMEDSVSESSVFVNGLTAQSPQKEIVMAEEQTKEAVEKTAQFTQADLDASYEKGKNEAQAEHVATGAKAERERIDSILSCDEAKGRDAQAKHIALKTDMSADDAKGILAASPQADEKGGFAAFNAAMQQTNVDLGADGSSDNESDEATAKRIASYS